MPRRLSIEFVQSPKPITEPVTKFGGQPVWIGKPQWPLSKTTNKQMQFICQVKLNADLFGKIRPQMAYLFMTPDDQQHVDETWDPEAGENALILQPADVTVATSDSPTGPTLYTMVKKLFKKRLAPKPCEYGVELVESVDPDYVDAGSHPEWTDSQWNEYHDLLTGNKIGGTPCFIQNAEFPPGGQWNLLLQLDSTSVPFYINFGDAGVGYAFLSEDGEKAKFLWQCS